MPTEMSQEQWPPPDCPPLVWPTLPDQAARLAWYRAVIKAYSLLWEGHALQPRLLPVPEHALSELEARLGCPLPAPLRSYHNELGALSLRERLCSVDDGDLPIQPLPDAYPGIFDLTEDETDLALAGDLIAFGDYLGNGNMFCFHRRTAEVFYFDHDNSPMLSRFFLSTEQYLDALMLRCLTAVYEDDEAGEAILVEVFGQTLVRKWLY